MKKTVKAWALVSKEGVSVGALLIRDNYHVFAIHQTKLRATKDRPKTWRGGNIYSVVPCAITYSLPSKKRK